MQYKLSVASIATLLLAVPYVCVYVCMHVCRLIYDKIKSDETPINQLGQ